MKIVFYSDKNYEHQAKSLIESILINGESDIQMIYYTIGFESTLNYKNLTKKIYPLDVKKPKFEYYKPSILLDAIDYFGGNFLFLDTDIIVGRRFNKDKFIHNFNYPLLSIGNWDYPFVCKLVDNEYQNVCDETNLMKYFGVARRSMNYVYTCIISFNESCRDFIFEWKSMCDNEYLLANRETYFPFPDETPMNILLWKRDIQNNYGRIYLNTLEFVPLKYIEENDNVVGDPNINNGIMGSDLMRCDNSSNVMFYHGIKDANILNEVVEYIKK
jgi:lipopolysaccharide biosynthesis glycosyltransferase